MYNEYTKATHLHKILERVQRQQQEELIHQQDGDLTLSAPPSPGAENGARSNANSPEPRAAATATLHMASNNNPQDEVIDYSKSGSCKRRLLVPTHQTSIFSGEFRNNADLQNFERLLELRYAKRKGTFLIHYLP